MIDLKQYEVWFVTGSQHLYGPKTLEQVAEHSREIAAGALRLGAHPGAGGFQAGPDHARRDPRAVPGGQFRQELHRPDHLDAHLLARQNVDRRAARCLQKPFLHLHTQYNRDIPWSDIDMDFMNLNQSAHGDREFGFIGSRMRLERKVVVGHWQDEEVQARSARGRAPPAPGTMRRACKIARFGDNMREVAVTEGDKVEAQMRLGYECQRLWRRRSGSSMSTRCLRAMSTRSSRTIEMQYEVVPALQRGWRSSISRLRDGARIEIGIRALPGGWQFQRLHHHLRRSARTGPAARPGGRSA